MPNTGDFSPTGQAIAATIAGYQGAMVAFTEDLVTGRRPSFELCPGLLETRWYAQRGVPAFAYGPGLLAVSHGPDEYVPAECLTQPPTVYALTACEALARPER